MSIIPFKPCPGVFFRKMGIVAYHIERYIVTNRGSTWFNLNQPATPASAGAQAGTQNSRPTVLSGPAASVPESARQSPAEAITEPPAATAQKDAGADAPAAEPAATQPLLAEFLAARESLTGTDTAFTTLLNLWDVEYSPPSGRGCAVAESAGLRSLRLDLTDDAGGRFAINSLIHRMTGQSGRDDHWPLWLGRVHTGVSFVILQRPVHGDALRRRRAHRWQDGLPPGGHGALW